MRIRNHASRSVFWSSNDASRPALRSSQAASPPAVEVIVILGTVLLYAVLTRKDVECLVID